MCTVHVTLLITGISEITVLVPLNSYTELK